MIHFNQTEEILRNADKVCYAMNVTIKAYSSPLVMMNVAINTTNHDNTTENHQVADWNNCTEIGTNTIQILLPVNKQTDTYPTANRVTNTAYNDLIHEWKVYDPDGDVLKIKNDFLTDLGPSYDGYVTS